MTNPTDLSVHPWGSFGSQPVAGFVNYDPQGAASGRMYMGLPINAQYLYGSFRTVDGSHYHAPIRHFHNDVSISLFLYTSETGKDFEYLRQSKEAHRGIVDTGEREGRWGNWRPEPDPRWEFTSDGKTARWVDRGFIDVTAEAVGQALQFAIPDADEPLVYTSQCFRNTGGTVLGKPVEGLWFHDYLHLAPGKGWSTAKYLLDLEVVWVAFATEFEDGTFHHGHLIHGHDNFSLAVIWRSDGEPIVRKGIEVEIDLASDGFQNSVVFHLGGDEVWEWEPFEGARMPRSPLAAGPHWREGVVKRRGETRRWKLADAWMETYRDHFPGAPGLR